MKEKQEHYLTGFTGFDRILFCAFLKKAQNHHRLWRITLSTQLMQFFKYENELL